MTTVLYIHGTLSVFAPMQQARLTGMYREARRHGWYLHAIDNGVHSDDLKQALDFWRPIGCMVEGGLVTVGRFPPADFAPVPVVYLDTKRPLPGRQRDGLQDRFFRQDRLREASFPRQD